MQQSAQLKQKYMDTLDVPLSKLEYNEEGEHLTTLYQTKWVRIIIVRCSETPDSVTLEVEVSLPSFAYETYPGSKDAPSEPDTRKVLTEAIEHLNYLLKLHNTGFSLDVIDQNCLWTASQEFSGKPLAEIFDTLVPP